MLIFTVNYFKIDQVTLNYANQIMEDNSLYDTYLKIVIPHSMLQVMLELTTQTNQDSNMQTLFMYGTQFFFVYLYYFKEITVSLCIKLYSNQQITKILTI